ncbi:MAG: hypothetical protein M1404_05165 [Acidobacteria bacterium]|nr:hypothetical protein [Acidobacteriota bacterium]
MAFKKAKALQEAHKYVNRGKNSLAIKQYRSILENDPSGFILLNTMGDLYVRDKDILEGLKPFYKLADAYVKKGFLAEFAKCAGKQKEAPRAYLEAAQATEIQGDTSEAECALSKVGDYKEALGNCTEVYGRNFDYRDVADKIGILQPRTS